MKLWRWIFRIVLVTLGICLFVLQSQQAKKTILEFIVNQPFKNSSFKLEVEGVRGLFPFQFEVTTLELKNKEEHVASLSNVSAVWSVPDLLSQTIKVNIVVAHKLVGDIIYKIDKHAFFSSLQGEGLPLWHKSLLKSVTVDLPELTLIKGNVSAVLEDGQDSLSLTMKIEEPDLDSLKFRDITLTGKEIAGKGESIIYPKQDKWEGTGSISIANLEAYDHWVEMGLQGSAHLTFKKSFQGQGNFEGHLAQFHYGEFEAKSLELKAHFDEIDRWKLTLQGRELLLNNIPFSNLLAKGSLEHGQGDFDVVAKGLQNISFHTQGVVDLSTDEVSLTEITLKRAELTHPLHQFFLKQPTTILWGENDIRASKVSISTGSGFLVIDDFTIDEDKLSGELHIDRLPLTILRVINPDWIATGSLTGKGSLRGTLEKPDAELILEGKSLEWGEPLQALKGEKNQFGRIDVSSIFKLSQGFLSWDVKLGKGSGFTLSSIGKVSVEQWYPTATSSFEGILKGQADMRILSTVMRNGDLIQGRASLDLIAKGTVEKPTIDGRISVVNGVYENASFGTLIRNISIDGKATRDIITIPTIRGQDNAAGNVSGRCTIKLTSILNPEIDLHLKLAKFIILQNDELSGKASGDLKIQGLLSTSEFSNLKITGDIIIQPLEIRLEDYSEKIVTIKLLEKRKNGTYQAPPDSHHQTEHHHNSSFLPLDIRLTSPGEIFVRGYGLDSQWKGEMRAVGSIMDPHIVGEINLVRGRFDLLGKPLKLEEGKIIYSPDPKNDPLLSVVGTREISEITAKMRVEGHASNPKITFSSTPALSQEEVLARLLFGGGLDSISGTQGLLLANALSSLKGKNNLNFTNKIRSAFGLDVLEFKERKPVEGEDFKSASQLVSVGKQLSDKVYLSLDQSVSGDGETTATVQFDVTPTFKIEADVGGNKNTGVGFAWVKKY